MDRFPMLGRRRIPLWMHVRKYFLETIYCKCRMPNDIQRAMIACDSCNTWYHKECVWTLMHHIPIKSGHAMHVKISLTKSLS